MAFRVATFNAGLAVGVLPHTTERLPHVISALSEVDADLLFVQEFWLQSHWEQLLAALRPRFPYVFRPQPSRARATPACREQDIALLRRCAERHCAKLSGEALARCMVRHCAAQALALSGGCLNCIVSDPTGSFEEIVARCLARAGEPGVAESTGSRGMIAYGGSFGTGLLAKAALEIVGTLVFDSSINARCAIAARVPLRRHGKVFVFATHLSPGGAEQEPQVARLLAWISELSGSAPAILVGDLNTTPGTKFFRAFESAGFHQAAQVDRRPTFASRGLEAGAADGSGYRLDHVLSRNLDAERSERILDQPITLQGAEGAIPTTLSDHFGVLAAFDDSLQSDPQLTVRVCR